MSDSDSDGPQVVRFTGTGTVPVISKTEKKRYLKSSAPKEAGDATASKRNTKEDEDDLKNDHALQRLLDESHILADAQNKHSGADISNIDFDPLGKARHKTMDRRLELLGAKSKQKGQVPMNIAKGIKSAEQTKKRKEIARAKEEGIVLAKSYKVDKKKPERRQRGLQIQSVGRNTKHGLVVSQKEIAKLSSRKKR